MRNEFLNKFFPPRRTKALMRAIQNFSKKLGEPFAIVWERYNDLLHALPHHGLNVGQIVAYFHQGLSLNNKQYIQMMCVGEFYEKRAREVVQFFDTITENARTWETNTSLDTAKVHSTPIGGGIHHLRENDDLQAKIANLTRKLEAIELKNVNEVIVVPRVPSVPMGSGVDESCIICDDPTHLTINCPNLPQFKGAIQIEQANALNYQRKPFNSPYSETYNSGWGKHPTSIGRMREAKTNFQITKARTSKTKAFQIKPLNSKIQGLKDFLRILTKGFTPLLKGNKINSFTNLHIREFWRTL